MTLSLTAAAASSFKPPVTTFSTPFSEPSSNKNGQPIIGGGLPAGNGHLLAYVFPNTKSFNVETNATYDTDLLIDEGVHFFVD